MRTRQKILILEHDNFLREIIRNLLYKKGEYILDGYSIDEGLFKAKKHIINRVVLGTSCPEYKGKETLNYIKKNLNQTTIPHFFIINDTNKEIDFISNDSQISINNLSVKKILETLSP